MTTVRVEPVPVPACVDTDLKTSWLMSVAVLKTPLMVTEPSARSRIRSTALLSSPVMSCIPRGVETSIERMSLLMFLPAAAALSTVTEVVRPLTLAKVVAPFLDGLAGLEAHEVHRAYEIRERARDGDADVAPDGGRDGRRRGPFGGRRGDVGEGDDVGEGAVVGRVLDGHGRRARGDREGMQGGRRAEERGDRAVVGARRVGGRGEGLLA